MPVNKKQLQRLIRLVAQLKENRYPNCKTFIENLQNADILEDIDAKLCRKTILRDIKLLKEEFKAPIRFDRQNNGYYLAKGWDLKVPQFLNESEMLAAVLGAHLAEEIFPEPLRSEIRNAVNFQLTSNSPDFLDSTEMNSLIVVPRLMIEINPEIFMVVFRAWQNHEAINIIYETADAESERM
jgi:predicted DNA-binding transcriptional regulator YafY